jgi:hypothetical protein
MRGMRDSQVYDSIFSTESLWSLEAPCFSLCRVQACVFGKNPHNYEHRSTCSTTIIQDNVVEEDLSTAWYFSLQVWGSPGYILYY